MLFSIAITLLGHECRVRSEHLLADREGLLYLDFSDGGDVNKMNELDQFLCS